MKAIIITWVSRGLWKDILEIFAKNNIFVYWLTRHNSEKLNLENIEIINCDIRKLHNIQSAKEHILTWPHEIIGIINNAWIWYRKDVIDETYEEITDTIETNLLGSIYCTKEFLPLLISKKFWTIITISSTAAFQWKAWRSTYAATKAALNLYMESLREEVKNENISISLICPWALCTPMRDPKEIRELKSTMLESKAVAKHVWQIFENNLLGLQTKVSIIQK